ncbi:MAG: glycoside hydrolase family protein [Planctomycetota bacterium]
MILSPQGLSFLKRAEGFRSHLYPDADGWAIGFGCQVNPTAWLGREITEIDAEALLRERLREFERAVNTVRVPLEQCQYDALVSLCVAPETRILSADFCWVAADSVRPGLQIWGIDEENVNGGKSRKLRIGVVESVKRFRSERLILLTDHGELTATPDHRILVQSSGHPKYRWTRVDRLSARMTAENGRRGGLRHGIYRLPYLPMWESDCSYDGGYLAGFLDGEGYATVIGQAGDKSLQVGFSQNDGSVSDLAIRLLRERGFIVGCHKPNKGVAYGQYNIQGGLPDVFRAVGTLRPRRLIANAMRNWDGVRGMYNLPKAGILEIKSAIHGEVISIQTSTKTFFSNGLISHNCFNIGAGAFRASTLVRLLDQGKVVEAANQFSRWRHSRGVVSDALVARRELERAMFLGEKVEV